MNQQEHLINLINELVSIYIKRACSLFILLLTFFYLQNTTIAQSKAFPYSLSSKDFVLLPSVTTIFFTGNYLNKKTEFNLNMREIERLDRNDINQFDRPATFNWNRQLYHASDVTLKVLLILPSASILSQLCNKEWKNGLTLVLMYLEVQALTEGIIGLTKSITGRIRPYLYNSTFTPEERYNLQGNEAPEAKSSFFSAHTSRAFASAVFLSKTFSDNFGNCTVSYLIWGTSLMIASITGYCRVASGMHFPTDVIAGAVIGSAVGYIIPELHKRKSEQLSLTVLPNSLLFIYKF